MKEAPETESKQHVQVKVSRLALVAISLAYLGLILFVAGIIIINRFPKPTDSTMPFYVVTLNLSFIFFISAIIIGIISYILIEKSGGKITGSNFATNAILISVFTCLLPIGIIYLSRVKMIAPRMICGTNLSGIGKAMLIYANDYDDKFPYNIGNNITWGTSVKWDAETINEAYGINEDGSGGSATISSSLYLLVKYAEVTPKSFICRGDKKMSLFEPDKYNKRNEDFSDFWDFGPKPWKHNSYSYHNPYGGFPLTKISDPSMAIAADRNPWIASLGWKIKDFNRFNSDGGKKNVQEGNTPTHANTGQNVLHLDSHVEFENESFCGINEDNIYTSWNEEDIRKGTPPKVGSQSAGKNDSLLVNDPPAKKP